MLSYIFSFWLLLIVWQTPQQFRTSQSHTAVTDQRILTIVVVNVLVMLHIALVPQWAVDIHEDVPVCSVTAFPEIKINNEQWTLSIFIKSILKYKPDRIIFCFRDYSVIISEPTTSIKPEDLGDLLEFFFTSSAIYWEYLDNVSF